MSQRGETSTDSGSIAPLYRRLPRGPHHLDAREVARHQRLRIYGAMVEAVAANGYAGTSVKQVVSLAGVSRRSFYEQFSNKQECFLATFDVIAAGGAKRIGEAYRSASGGLAERLGACYGALTDGIGSNSKRARLAIVETQTAGAMGLTRLHLASATFEQMLCTSFAHAPDAHALPAPLVRAILGGVKEPISLRLREGRAHEIPALANEMVSWTLLYQTPKLERLSESLLRRASVSRAGRRHHVRAPDRERLARSPRPVERLWRSVLELAASEDYEELGAVQIAEYAGVAPQAFYELYDSKEDCFLAAFDALAEELLGLAADPELIGGDWPRSVRRVTGELMALLAAEPLYADTIARVAPGAGPSAMQRAFGLIGELATLLTEGASQPGRTELAGEAIAGAILHTIRCQVVRGQAHLLPALADYLAYIVLAPYIGADAAAELLIEQGTGPAGESCVTPNAAPNATRRG